ncbi:MAG: hypothetical protein KIT45_15240 [Fimbriimonadia bacterium]|nr:hypothetical protein [Fimbriimonadia bacterium]
MMRKPSRAKTGCLVVVSVALLLVFIGAFQWLKPIDIEVPERKYPPDNAYDQLKKLSEQISQLSKKDARFARGTKLVSEQVSSNAPTLSPQDRADIQYFLNQYEPYRQKIVLGLKQPSTAVLEYRFDWLFSELAEFRQFARYNAYLMTQAREKNDLNRVLNLYEEGMIFAQQIDNEGVLIHYLVVLAIEAITHNQMTQIVPKLNAAQCERLVKFLRQHLKNSTPPAEAMTFEKWMAIQFLIDFQKGKYSESTSFQEVFSVDSLSPLMRYSNLRWAASEVENNYAKIVSELDKPANQQKLAIHPVHPLNKILLVSPDSIGYAAAQRESHLRATACAAAVRSFKLKTGRYPKTLQEAGVQDLNVDPYTGGEFVYKVDPSKGFLIYSLGADGVDDGGRLAKSRDEKGDVSYRSPRRNKDGTYADDPIWLK